MLSECIWIVCIKTIARVELARVEGIGYARAARIKRVLECNTTSSNMRTTSLDNYTQDMLDAND